MKKSIVLCAILVTAVVIDILGVFSILNKPSYRHTEPPPGWTVQYNGSEYRWLRPNGTHSAFREDNRLECVKSAWRQKEYEERLDAETWKDAP